MNNKISVFANDVQAPIKVELHENGQYFVSARELHAFLEVKSKFADWMKNRISQYDFNEVLDYTSFSKMLENGGREIQYCLSINMAKELAMVENNHKGKEARHYFISCEDKLKQIQELIIQHQNQTLQSFEKDIVNNRKDVDNILKFLNKEFPKVQECFEYVDARIDDLEAQLKNDNQILDHTVVRVDKIEETLDFKAVACVYVMYCPQKQWYKIGSSHDAKQRKKDFSTSKPHLTIVFEILISSRKEAYSLENTLKKRFATKHREGEWYALTEDDLIYLQDLQQTNKIHLLKMA